jgi:hypothetical protein
MAELILMSIIPEAGLPDREPGDLGRLGRRSSLGLGSLAQSARRDNIRQARRFLVGAGVLLVLAHAVLFTLAEHTVRSEVDKELKKAGPGANVDQAKLRQLEAEAVREIQLESGGAIALGAAFIVLGLMVQRFPVPATAVALVAAVAANVILAAHEPATIGRGIVLKVIIVIALVISFRAALAYEREARAASESPA